MTYVTHDQIEAMTLADRIVVLRAGKIEQVAALIELFKRPVNTFVAGFVGAPCMNFLTREEAAPILSDVLVPAMVDTVGIRPQHLEIADSGLGMTITLVEALGTETVLHGTLASGTRLLATMPRHHRFAEGDVLTLAASDDQLHFFDAGGQRIDAEAA